MHNSFVLVVLCYPECFACCGVCRHGEGSMGWSWLGARSPQTWPADPARSPHSRHHRPNRTHPHCRRHPRRSLFKRKDFQFWDVAAAWVWAKGQITSYCFYSLQTQRLHHRDVELRKSRCNFSNTRHCGSMNLTITDCLDKYPDRHRRTHKHYLTA